MLAAVTPDDVTAITRKWVEMAREGDLVAGELLAKYAGYGKCDLVDPDRLDLDELSILTAGPEIVANVEEQSGKLTVALAIELMRSGLIGDLDTYVKKLRETIERRRKRMEDLQDQYEFGTVPSLEEDLDDVD
jgi:hypothetical protein